MPSQIRILNIHATGKEKSLTALFSKKKLSNIKIAEVYYISPELLIHQHATVSQLLSNPISQKNININNIIDYKVKARKVPTTIAVKGRGVTGNPAVALPYSQGSLNLTVIRVLQGSISL